jgi:hypothetical protein
MSPRRRPPKRGAEFFAEHSARFFAATSPAEKGVARLDLALALCRALADGAEAWGGNERRRDFGSVGLPELERDLLAAREAADAGDLGTALAVCAHYVAVHVALLPQTARGMLLPIQAADPPKPGSKPRGRPEGKSTGKFGDPEFVAEELSRLRGSNGKPGA